MKHARLIHQKCRKTNSEKYYAFNTIINIIITKFLRSGEESNPDVDSSVSNKSSSSKNSNASAWKYYDGLPKQKKCKTDNAGKKLAACQITNQIVIIVTFPVLSAAEITTNEPNNKAQVMVSLVNVKVRLLVPALCLLHPQCTCFHFKLCNYHHQQIHLPNYLSHLKELNANEGFK